MTADIKYGPWKIWNGGECPVDPETKVQFQRANQIRTNAETRVPVLAQCLFWDVGERFNSRIIAYREVIESVVETKTYRYGMGRDYDDGNGPLVSYTNLDGGFVAGDAVVTVEDGRVTRFVWEPDQ